MLLNFEEEAELFSLENSWQEIHPQFLHKSYISNYTETSDFWQHPRTERPFKEFVPSEILTVCGGPNDCIQYCRRISFLPHHVPSLNDLSQAKTFG